MVKINSCMNCRHYRSFYVEYNFDEKEPIWSGRCLNEKQEDDDKEAGEGILCKLWEEDI
jgi:hypothetical protein